MGGCFSKGKSLIRHSDPTVEHPDNMGNTHSAAAGKGANGTYQHAPEIPRPVSSNKLNESSRATHQAVELLGKGTEGETWAFRNLKTHEITAIKLVKRPVPAGSVAQLVSGLSIQAEVGESCVNVVSVKEVMLTNHYLAIVMESASGGNLTAYVAKQYNNAQKTGLFVSEDEARYYFRQFLSAVYYCHQHKIAHRDLKLDNTLLDGHTPPYIKITDFGFAKRWTERTMARMNSHLGTPVYMAPEVIHDKEYDAREVDVWASGVMLLVMLMGAFPFDPIREMSPDKESAAIWVKEMTTKWSAAPQIQRGLAKITPELRDLLDKIFTPDPKKRITLEGILEHPWYKKPLAGQYQAAWDRLGQEQGALDRFLEQHPPDPALVNERNLQLEALLKEASSKPKHVLLKHEDMRPLSLLSLSKPGIKRIDLRPEAVAQKTDGMASKDSNPSTSSSAASRGYQAGHAAGGPVQQPASAASPPLPQSPFASVKGAL